MKAAMQILLAFAPFIVFAVIDRIVGTEAGLISAAAVSAILLVRDALRPGKKVKILEIGTFLLFGGLALYTFLAHAAWSIIGVRLCVDAGLLLVVLVSMAVGQPFTLQYARETVAPDQWNDPAFKRINYTITAVWAAAFALMVAADLVMLCLPQVPLRVGIWVTVLAIYGAVRFTSWYPERQGRDDSV